MTKRTVITALNSDTDASNVNPEAIKAITATGATVITAINSMMDFLEEPLKSKFLEIKNQINTALEKLPATDQVPAALNSDSILRQLLSVMSYAQDLINTTTNAAKQMGAQVQTMKASITSEVEAGVAAKIKEGAFISKADHDAAIATAINSATAAARQSALDEVKAISDRKTALASAGIPVPSDAVLASKDEEFAAKQAEAKARVEALKPFTVSAAHMTTLCWGPKETFDTSVAVLTESIAAGKGKTETPAKGANAFCTGSSATGKSNPTPMFG